MGFNVMGIDPGVSGGWVFIGENGRILSGKNPSSILEMYELLKYKYANVTVIERMVPAAWGGAQNNATLMRNFGWWEMWVENGVSLKTIYLMPKQWQKLLGIKRNPPKLLRLMTEKEQSQWYRIKKKLNLELARKLFPKEKITHYTADAFLLAEVARKIFLKELIIVV